MERERIDNIEVLEYVLFCIEGIAEKIGKGGSDEYLTEDLEREYRGEYGNREVI